MAQRFGGEFSPDPQAPKPGPLTHRAPLRGRARSRLMFFLPLPLLFLSMGKPPVEMAVDIAAAATLILAAWLLQEGLKAEQIWAERKVARRPAIPRKIFATALTGIGITLATMSGLSGLGSALIYGAIAAALHSASFGIDPLRDKGMEGIDPFQSDRVARALDEAEKHLTAMSDAVARSGDRRAVTRVEQFQSTARQMFRTVQDDPRDLSAARKFLGVYLLGARDATVKFADLFAATRDEKARRDYLALLDDLEAGFEAKREKLMLSDRTDLDVEIEVLRDRLASDGLTLKD